MIDTFIVLSSLAFKKEYLNCVSNCEEMDTLLIQIPLEDRKSLLLCPSSFATSYLKSFNPWESMAVALFLHVSRAK